MTLPASIHEIVASTHGPQPKLAIGTTIFALLFLAIGGLLAYLGANYLRTYNRIRTTEPRDIRTIQDPAGEVELTGTARIHEETTRSPFTDTECLATEWSVKRHSSSGKGSSWTTIDRGDDRRPFRLDAPTGMALIDPNGGALEGLDETVIEVRPGESPPPAISEFLDRSDVAREHNRTRRYYEWRLEPDDDVHVLGPVRRVAHSVDMPGGADVVVGVDDPDRGFTLGEDDLSAFVDYATSEKTIYTITNAGERGAQRHMLKKGLGLVAFGLVFALVPVGLLVFG